MNSVQPAVLIDGDGDDEGVTDGEEAAEAEAVDDGPPPPPTLVPVPRPRIHEVPATARTTAAAMVTSFIELDMSGNLHGTRRARISQARYSARASVQTELATVRDVELEMRRAWNAIRASLGRMGPLERRAADAGKSLKLNLSRFKAGVATLDTILALQDEASASQVAALNENAAYRYNVFRVLGAAFWA